MTSTVTAPAINRDAQGAGSYKWWALSATSFGAVLASLNMSTLVIALPVLLRALHVGVLDAVWILLAYMLTQTATLVTVGRLGDMWGRKRLYVIGFAVFTVASLATGFASVAWVMIALRCVGGLGGALMVANSGAIVTDAFPAGELGMALGINGMVLAVGMAVGPVLGGWLTTLGWQWVFWFNVPFGVIGTVWSALVLREVGRKKTKERIDWIGNVLLLVALTGLLLALSMGGIQGWTQPLVIGGAVAFILGFPLFLWIEQRVTQPMLDLTLFRIRLFAIGNLTQLINGTARMGLLFLLVFYFQGPEQKDPVTAGLLVTPMALLMLVISPISGWLSDHIGSRLPSTAGLVVTGVGLAGMAYFISTSVAYPLLAFWLSLVGLGAGLFSSPNSSSIMVSVPPIQRGVASGVRMMVNFTGSMISIAFVLAIVTSSLPPPIMLRIFSGVTAGVPASQVAPFVNGVRVALYVLAALSLATAPLSLLRGSEESRRGMPAGAGARRGTDGDETRR